MKINYQDQEKITILEKLLVPYANISKLKINPVTNQGFHNITYLLGSDLIMKCNFDMNRSKTFLHAMNNAKKYL